MVSSPYGGLSVQACRILAQHRASRPAGQDATETSDDRARRRSGVKLGTRGSNTARPKVAVCEAKRGGRFMIKSILACAALCAAMLAAGCNRDASAGGG